MTFFWFGRRRLWLNDGLLICGAPTNNKNPGFCTLLTVPADPLIISIDEKLRRKPRRAFHIFKSERYDEIRFENGGLKTKAAERLCYDVWKRLTESERQRYVDREESEKQAWNQHVQSAGARRGKNSRHRTNPYCLFTRQAYTELRREYPNASVRLLSSKAAERWRAMSVEDKKTFYTAADRLNNGGSPSDKSLQQQGSKTIPSKAESGKAGEDENWRTVCELTQTPEQAFTRTRLSQVRDSIGMPGFPPNPFFLFVQELKANVEKSKRDRSLATNGVVGDSDVSGGGKQTEKKLNNEKIFQQASTLWASLSETERSVYVERCRQGRETYRSRLKIWEDEMREAGMSDLIRISSPRFHTKQRSDS